MAGAFCELLAVRGIYVLLIDFKNVSRALTSGSRIIPNARLYAVVELCQILSFWQKAGVESRSLEQQMSGESFCSRHETIVSCCRRGRIPPPSLTQRRGIVSQEVDRLPSCDTKPWSCVASMGGGMSAVSHSRYVCCVTQYTCLLW